MSDIALYIETETFNDMLGVLTQLFQANKDTTYGYLSDQTNIASHGNNNLDGEPFEKVLQDLYAARIHKCYNEIVAEANKLSDKIYGSQLTGKPKLAALDNNPNQKTTIKIDISAITSKNTIHALRTAMNPIGSFLSLFGLGIIKPTTKLSVKKLTELTLRFHDTAERDKFIKKRSTKLASGMTSEKLLYNKFNDAMSEQVELALGKVLFLVFDEEPRTK